MVLIMSLGTELKEAREAQGLSLDTLQETTKIQKRYLQAIEEEKLHILPGKFYARAFIKEYANAVGLDPNVLMEQHQNDIPNTEDDSTVQYTHMQRSRRNENTQKSSKLFSVIPTIIVVLLVLGIIFFAWYLTQKTSKDDTDPNGDANNNTDEIIRNSDNGSPDDTNEDNGDNADDTASNSKDEDTDKSNDNDNDDDEESGSSETASEFSVVKEGTGNSPESEMDFTFKDDTVSLKVESTGNSWLDVKNESEEVLYSSNLMEEESPLELDVSDEDKLFLNIGNAKDLKVSINDVEMEYPVDTNEVHQHIWINLINENE